MLKKFLLAALIIFSVQATAQANNIFNVVNDTHKSITEIYIAPTDSDNEWILFSVNYLRDGESTAIYFDGKRFKPRSMLRYFKIGVNYDDFTQEIWYDLDLYNFSEITLSQGNHTVKFK